MLFTKDGKVFEKYNEKVKIRLTDGAGKEYYARVKLDGEGDDVCFDWDLVNNYECQKALLSLVYKLLSAHEVGKYPNYYYGEPEKDKDRARYGTKTAD